MTRPTVVLFDIDGTLVSTGGAGRRALERAFEQAYGRGDACSHFVFDGMTDRAIARNGLTAIGVEPSLPNIEAILATYVRCLEVTVTETQAGRYVVHPGMREAIAATLERKMAVGLGTGNIREGARVKLEHVDLYRHFSFGGFGDDHELRPELIRAGALRGAAQLGLPLGEVRVVVIGDTPKDVDAAVAIGADCVGVGTGGFSAQALLAHGAKWAFHSLAEPGALEAVLEGG